MYTNYLQWFISQVCADFSCLCDAVDCYNGCRFFLKAAKDFPDENRLPFIAFMLLNVDRCYKDLEYRVEGYNSGSSMTSRKFNSFFCIGRHHLKARTPCKYHFLAVKTSFMQDTRFGADLSTCQVNLTHFSFEK